MTRRSPFARVLVGLPLALVFVAGPVAAQSQRPAPDPGPAVVGFARPLSLTPNLDDSLETNGELLWSDMLRADGASFLKAHFVNVNLRRGDQLVVRSRSGKVVEQITGRGVKDLGTFWALAAYGDELLLEFTYSRPYDYLPFYIDQVVVGDASIFDPPDEPESVCSPSQFEDVICYESDAGKWDTVRASVGVMSVGGNPVSALFCSGSNVSPLNYILTNDHCLGSQAECNNTEFVFKFYRTNCNSGAAPTVDWEGFHCDTLVASSPFIGCNQGLGDLDFALTSVVGDPAATFGFVEPDPIPLTDGEDIYIVQHPSGRPHEITHGGGTDVDVDGTVLRYYDTLDTEGGSSGSPIFRELDNKLIGLHHCGGCSTPGTGNRGMLMSDIYPLIESFLCPAEVTLTVTGNEDLHEVMGNGDAALDPGETWAVTPRVTNEACGAIGLGATARVQVNPTSTMPIHVLTPTIGFGDIAGGASAPALQPVRFKIGLSAECAGDVVLDLVNLSATNGGPFPDAPGFFSAPMGGDEFLAAYFDDFAGGQGAWTIEDGGTGSGPASTWTTANPGGQSVPLVDPFFIVDSEALGAGEVMDESLISPVFSTVGLTDIRLQFHHDFNWSAGGLDEVASVSVRSSQTLGNWIEVVTFQGSDASGVVDVSLNAGGHTNAQVRFSYSNAEFESWWAVDNVRVLGNSGGIACKPYTVAPRGLLRTP
ncbi:MAG: hypothetical protein ACI8QZ_003857 [Chlamydiales bacterium]|jgi:hypothetical protein